MGVVGIFVGAVLGKRICFGSARRGVRSLGLASLLTTTSIVGVLSAGTAIAGPLPSGGQTVAGEAKITSAGSTLTVNQTSQRAILSWSDFSIAQGAAVQFNNGSGATLNRVTGGSVSSLDGVLGATGSVYLINPNGVVIGKTGVINTGGTFVASTLDTKDAAFMTGGALSFSGASTASVINFGKVGSLGGDVALIGASVENDGTLTAPKGTVGLVAGRGVILRDAALDGGLFAVEIGGADSSVTNRGSIAAAAAELRAQGGNIYALAGNTGGVINAREVSGQGGHIWLTAPGGTVTVDRGAVLDASAGDVGDGGHILVDSASTSFSGTALARGGVLSGNGGFIETSGDHLTAHGAIVDTSAAAGKTGTWLIDPADFTIAASGGDMTGAELSDNLFYNSVTIKSSWGKTVNGNGDINVNDAVSWDSSHTLTLDAYRNININKAITVTGEGGVALIYGDQTQTGAGSAESGGLNFGLTDTGFSGSLDFGVEDSNGVVQNVGGSLTINGAQYTLLYSMNGLQGINKDLVGNYALAASLDATSMTNWVPIGTDDQGNVLSNGKGFSGGFTGLGHTISNLTINLPDTDDVGLFGNVIKSSIDNIGLIGGYLTGLNHEDAARFSFLTGTPIIIAATVHEAPKLLKMEKASQALGAAPTIDLPLSLAAGAVAGAVAFVSLWLLMRWFKTHEAKSFDPFAYYCMGFGAIATLINIVAP
jgi:filamentous hemagglutinin family protein